MTVQPETPKHAAKVLLAVHTGTFLTEIGQLALRLLLEPRYSPELMIYPYALAERDARRFKAAGVPCLDQFGRSFSSRDASLGVFQTVARMVRSLCRRVALFDLLGEVIELTQRRNQLQRLLRSREVDLVVLGGDMVGYDTAAYISACHREGIPAVIVPSTMSNGLEQAEVYSGDPRHGLSFPLNNFVAGRYPKWLFTHRGARILRERGARALALEWLGLAPPLPWIFNSGRADAVTVESSAMKDYYVEAGLPPARLLVTGSPSDDAMANTLLHREARRHELCVALGLDAEKPIVLCALPPDSLYMSGGRPECDFEEYGTLVDFWIDRLARLQGASKIVCVHPSVSAESMRHFETHDLKIAALPTSQLVPLCDVYVASVSSTIRWAIACGKPVINYDVYRYRYTDYVGLKGVLATEEQSDFTDLLDRLVSDVEYRESISALQREDAPRYGRLDGKAGDRIVALMDSLIAERSTIPQAPEESPSV